MRECQDCQESKMDEVKTCTQPMKDVMQNDEQVDSSIMEKNPAGVIEPPSEFPEHTSTPFHSSFSTTSKKLIVALATASGFFSPMTGQIYIPALNQIASDLHVSSSQINLTITTYLIFQGLAPSITAGFSEGAGRRPAYMICFIVYIAANIGLALQDSYAALLVLRCLQSAGISGTVALSSGVVADLVTSSERGIYIGITSMTSILAPSLSPVLGGLFAEYLDWRWIFWFLAIIASVFFVPLILFMPETCRQVVADGSFPPPRLCQSITSIIRDRRRLEAGQNYDEETFQKLRSNYRVRFPNPLITFKLLFEKENGLMLLCNGILVACMYSVMTGIPSIFGAPPYNLSSLKISLVFLPFAGGSVLSIFTTGKLVDRAYRKYAIRHNIPLIKNKEADLSQFPIEQARLEVALPLQCIGCVGMIAYSWTINFDAPLAAPLVLLGIIGYAVLGAGQVMSVLLIDLNPTQPATATAANNLSRCLLGAGATAVLGPMLKVMGRGWTYTFMSLVWLGITPALWVLMRRGPQWRREKIERTRERAQAKIMKLNVQALTQDIAR